MIFRTPSRAACTLSVGMILLAATTVATTLFAEQLGSGQSSSIAKLVCEMVEANHISQKPIDDKTSAKLVDEFIKTLDPQKLYFLQSDIDRFNKFRTGLDDLIKAGNLDFARNVFFDTYLPRIEERINVAYKLIDADHDFTVQESIEIDAKDLPWAKTPEELNERWRKQIKYDLLRLKLDKPIEAAAAKENPDGAAKTPDASSKPLELDPKKRLHKRYKTIYDSLRKTEDEEVVEMYLTALCGTFDPHSSYMSPRSGREFEIMMALKLEGIGAALQSDDGYTIVKNIVKGGAAEADGRLKVEDKIVAVANGNAEFVDVIEMKLTKVVDMIRGKAGTKVRLKVLPHEAGEEKGEARFKIYELTRKKVELTQSEVKGEIIDTGSRVKGTRARIGVVHIPSFYRDFKGSDSGDEDFKSAARDVKKVLRDFDAKGGVDAVIVDLRYNGGGSLIEAIEISGLFIDEGPVVQVKDYAGKMKTLPDDEKGMDSAKPLVVVTNRLSASASEIFAGVIKDYRRGLIVGDRTTHGKGTVQNVTQVGNKLLQLFRPPDLGSLKLTIQQFYRVNGESTQNLGVPSDVALPSLMDNMDLGEQFLDNALPFDKEGEVKYKKLALVTPDMIPPIREASKKRVTASADFQRTEKDIERYLARKQRKSVSLNEEELRKERVEEEQKTRDKADNPDDATANAPIFPDTSYNNELLSITLDYLSQLQQARTARK